MTHPALRLAPLLAFACVTGLSPALAQAPNLSANPNAIPTGTPGTAHRLVVAQRTWQQALTTGDVLPMLVAIRLARSVTLRPAPAWKRTTSGDAAPEAPKGRDAAPDPASAAALAIVRNLAGEDPNLQDLVYDLDAQLPRARLETATQATADLAPGQTDTWHLALFGEVEAELALIGDGDSPLSLTLMDEAGNILCASPPSLTPALCRLTPARNGFFTATIQNPGSTVNSYRLIGN
jgi:hypothetical protein